MILKVFSMFYYHFGMIRTGHRKGYVWRGRSDYYLLMRFRNDFFIRVGGQTRYGKAGDMVLHAPHTDAMHGASVKGVGFINDWIFFKADEAEAEFLRQLPYDTPIPGDGTDRFAEHLTQIHGEAVRGDSYSDTLISHQIYGLLTLLARSCKEHKKQERDGYGPVNSVRMELYKNCQQPWTLEDMAKKSGYSVSHFCARYKQWFGVSPMDDLLQARLERAKQLLNLKTYKVSEVAVLCGFSSLHYFSTFFKKRTGKSPSRY